MLSSQSQHQPSHGLLKQLLDFGPLLLFFLANWAFGLMTATAIFMVVSVVTVALHWLWERKLPVIALITLVLVLFFGGLTLFLADERFIKMKPTFVYSAFAAILLGGLLMRRYVLKSLFEAAFQLDDAGWRKLSWRWIGFFVVMALLNEALWRSLSTDQWVAFKSFAPLPLTLLFIMTQLPLLRRHGRQTLKVD